MTNLPHAKLAYITNPEGRFLLNLQFETRQDRVLEVTVNGNVFERVEINREQLSNIVADGAKFLVGASA